MRDRLWRAIAVAGLMVAAASFLTNVVLWERTSTTSSDNRTQGGQIVANARTLVRNSCEGTSERKREVGLLVAVVDDNPEDSDVENLRAYYEDELLPSLVKRAERLQCKKRERERRERERRRRQATESQS